MNVSGTWQYSLVTEYGIMEGIIDLTYSAERMEGSFVNMGKEFRIYNGQVNGNCVSFDATLHMRTGVMMLAVEAIYDDRKMAGMFKTPLGDSPFSAHRA